MDTDSPPATPLAILTDRLRALRLAAGRPTFRGLAEQSGLPKSTVSNAFSGKHLPRQDTVHAIVDTLGGDVEAFLDLYEAAAPKTTQTPEPAPEPSRIAVAHLRRDSLVGSYFHGDAERPWQGCVVAEPAPQVYLVETFSWIAGDSVYQQLVPLAEMTGWRFYDTATWMKNAYLAGDLEWKRPPHDWED